MKKKYFLLISFLFLGVLFIKDFYLRQVRATSSWYATFTYNDKTYAFSHNYQYTDWNSIIPGFSNSVNPDPDGNAGVKGQDWCNHTLIIDGEDNNYDDWFVPNGPEFNAAGYYEGDNPWDLPAYEAHLWSSSTNTKSGRWHRASAFSFLRYLSGRNDDKITPDYFARCVRVVSGPSPTPTATPSASPSPTPSPSPSPTPPPDFKFLLSNWGSANPDLNGDGLVNGLDFGNLLRLLQ